MQGLMHGISEMDSASTGRYPVHSYTVQVPKQLRPSYGELYNGDTTTNEHHSGNCAKMAQFQSDSLVINHSMWYDITRSLTFQMQQAPEIWC